MEVKRFVTGSFLYKGCKVLAVDWKTFSRAKEEARAHCSCIRCLRGHPRVKPTKEDYVIHRKDEYQTLIGDFLVSYGK